MEIAKFIEIGSELLKLMSEYDVRVEDWKNLRMYDEYKALRKSGAKYRSVIIELSERYKTSQSNVERIVRRLKKEVK